MKANQDEAFQREMSGIFGHYWIDTTNKGRKVNIKEVPFMVSEQGEVVCFNIKGDQPTVGIIGRKSSGKSYTMHSIADRMFYYKKVNMCHLNDFQHETLSWCTPNSSVEDKKTLELTGETVKPLPMVYCVPSSHKLKTDYDHIKLSIPFKDFLEHFEMFLGDMARSGDYLKGMKDDIFKCNTPEEILTVVDNCERLKKNFAVKNKIKTRIQNFMDEHILDFTEPEGITTLKTCNGVAPYRGYTQPVQEELEYHALSALMHANLVPVLLTGTLVNEDYYEGFIKYIADDLINNQRDDPYFSDRKSSIMVLIDEITMLYSTNKRTGHAAKSFQVMCAQGRPLRIGMIYVTQNYSKVETILRTNTTHLLVFKLTSKTEINEIAGDHGLQEHHKERMLSLEKFQLLACGDFVCYNSTGQRRVTNEPIIGKTLPTLSKHQAPNVEA